MLIRELGLDQFCKKPAITRCVKHFTSNPLFLFYYCNSSYYSPKEKKGLAHLVSGKECCVFVLANPLYTR